MISANFHAFMQQTGYRVVGTGDWSLEASLAALRRVDSTGVYDLTFTKRVGTLDVYLRARLSNGYAYTSLDRLVWSMRWPTAELTAFVTDKSMWRAKPRFWVRPRLLENKRFSRRFELGATDWYAARQLLRPPELLASLERIEAVDLALGNGRIEFYDRRGQNILRAYHQRLPDGDGLNLDFGQRVAAEAGYLPRVDALVCRTIALTAWSCARVLGHLRPAAGRHSSSR